MGLWHDGALMVAWGPSYDRHGERHRRNALPKRLTRYRDDDDAHDGELPAYSRCLLCLPPEWAIFNHLLDRQARSWFWPPVPVLSAVNPVLSYWPLGGSPLSPRSPLYGRGFWICGRDTRVFSRVYGVSPRGCCGLVVTAVTNAVHAGPPIHHGEFLYAAPRCRC
jgi:hypothetical protein